MEKTNVSIRTRLIWAAYILFHQLVALVIAYIVLSYDVTILRSWHNILCSVGFVLFMYEGILFLSPHNWLNLNLKKSHSLTIHGIVLTLGVILISVGIIIQIVLKGPSVSHFTSPHAIVGLVSWICCLLAVLAGIFAKWIELTKLMKIKPLWMKFFHSFVGLAGFELGLVSIILIFYPRAKFEANAMAASSITIVILGVHILFFLSGRTIINQIKSILRWS